MTAIKAHFDGKVIVPDEPVELPVGEKLVGTIESEIESQYPLLKLARILDALPHQEDGPTDGAAQHDHYLYGTPKRDDLR
jgi:hypothetical protein